MKSIFAAGALVAGSLVLSAAGSAQGAPVYRYCLMEGSHPNTAGMVLCRFDTLAQCMASRNGFGDTCYVNPQYGERQQRR